MLVEYDERGSIINDYYLYIGNIYIYIYIYMQNGDSGAPNVNFRKISV